MSDELPICYLARHGETAWSLSGQHTGSTDIPLTAHGEASARRLGARLAGLAFARVLTSPSQRASRTCEIAGFGGVAEVERDLSEWNYGDYEGRRSVDIHLERPEWEIFRDGCPNGESPEEIGTRADRVVARIRAVEGHVLVFSSAHILRVLAARWVGWPSAGGRGLVLGTGTLSALSYEHTRSNPVIRLWNESPREAGQG